MSISSENLGVCRVEVFGLAQARCNAGPFAPFRCVWDSGSLLYYPNRHRGRFEAPVVGFTLGFGVRVQPPFVCGPVPVPQRFESLAVLRQVNDRALCLVEDIDGSDYLWATR